MDNEIIVLTPVLDVFSPIYKMKSTAEDDLQEEVIEGQNGAVVLDGNVASLSSPSSSPDTLPSSSACTANLSTLGPAADDEDVPGRLVRPLFIARGNLVVKVGTAIGPTGRHTAQCVKGGTLLLFDPLLSHCQRD